MLGLLPKITSTIQFLKLGISLQNNLAAKYTMHNTVTLTGTPGSLSYAEHYIDCDDGTGSDLATTLNHAFNVIVTNITVKTNAWKVSDTMGDMVNFDSFVSGKDGGAAIGDTGALEWNLKALAATPVKDSKTDRWVYTIQYYVTLKDGYEAGTVYETNKIATLTYSFEDDVYTEDTVIDGVSHIKGEQKLYTSEFVKPTVKGFRANIPFLKQNVNEEPLTDAQFQLFAADAFSASNPGTALFNRLVGRAVFANADRIVRHDIGDGQMHKRGQTHGRFAIVGEHEEGGAIRVDTAVELQTVCHCRHRVFTNTEMNISTREVVGRIIAVLIFFRIFHI